MKNYFVSKSRRLRGTPYTSRIEKQGVTAYTVYNHMLLPTKFEDSLEDKPLKLYSKKINLESGVPEKIDGPVKLISYEKKMPLDIELEYFVNHLSDEEPEISNIKHGYEVMKTLVDASKQILI